jgi:hypothetical protein
MDCLELPYQIPLNVTSVCQKFYKKTNRQNYIDFVPVNETDDFPIK